jgi:hypothetical protein
MSLQRMRRWSRLVALMLLLAAIRGLPHLAQDDDACADLRGSYQGHDETDHALGPAGQSHTDHCALCHWTRLLRDPRPALGPSVGDASLASRFYWSDVDVYAAPALEHLPARAPPAVLL